MSTLTEMMYGNINIFERPFDGNGKYEKLTAELLELEKALKEELPEDKKELFCKYLAVTDRRQLIADEALFTNGFSLGARIM